jgi:hypothetical protein
MSAKPAIVMPVHDPQGLILPRLTEAIPELAGIFGKAYLGITDRTQVAQPVAVEALAQHPLCDTCCLATNVPADAQWVVLFKYAAEHCQPGQWLHLCFPDRVLFALRSEYREQFVADVAAVDGGVAVLFQRSTRAWATHPANYMDIEGFATRIGECLLGRSLDFCWCHMAVPAAQLATVLPQIRARVPYTLAELVLLLNDGLVTKDVDWLAWEDPFLLSVNADALKAEREHDPQETLKRLSYVVPTIQRLMEWSRQG